MADNYLPYQNPSTTDAKLDSESLTVGANTVHRERVQVSGAGATDIAPVDATAGLKVDLGADNDVKVTSGLNLGTYDYVSMALSAGNTTETYTLKSGGSGGTTVSTVVIVYTDSTRDVISSVTKS